MLIWSRSVVFSAAGSLHCYNSFTNTTEGCGFWRHNKRVSLSFCTLHFSVACLMCTIGQHCFSCLNPSLSLSLTSSPSLIAAVAAVALADHRREHREWKELSYRLNIFPKGLISPTSPVLLIDFFASSYSNKCGVISHLKPLKIVFGMDFFSYVSQAFFFFFLTSQRIV